jgi:aspartyl-tRNA(Asn)/glutamyl-tRNA(Gln) amidotransferase subunit C
LRKGTGKARTRAKTLKGTSFARATAHNLEGWAGMAITREEVLHVAKLARLELTDDEVERLTEQLGAILEAVSKVSELDLSDVPPTSHPLELVNAWAPDELRESLSLDEVFANAPAREGDLFKVPPTS